MYEARDIHFRAGRRTLLTGASVRVVPGRVTVLIGPNGAGKSTLLKVLAGEYRPHAGDVWLAGTDIRELRPSELASLRAVVPQSAQLAFPFTVAEIVAIGSDGGRQSAPLIRRVLDQVQLGGFEARPYDELSGGERQRVQIARALAQLAGGTRPGYLLLDEPTASLDLAQQLLVIRHLRRMAAEEGVGVLAVLHDLNLAAMAADTILAMRDGTVLADGAPGSVLTDATIHALYGVQARVGWTPAAPFLLPQSVEH
ncbi:heme ABC transporter ATP-binding protein [Ancylobacter sp. WKF20]|uniref:heme ABC transporter ATP-binding protein n=1 Tax=Ancylobacter sp. WKF20 TaxID=3039801 RepID=UPI00243414D2|nr:heme ABC transporter ATP-binding protein [Ancylobacter sp. WKF20]WGD28383.1 heme ABC transporter ATP-binding protein [Ancylobacter sp. WKF20]